jgi:hypothetical protein
MDLLTWAVRWRAVGGWAAELVGGGADPMSDAASAETRDLSCSLESRASFPFNH